jgi:hypothetical protein
MPTACLAGHRSSWPFSGGTRVQIDGWEGRITNDVHFRGVHVWKAIEVFSSLN